MWPQLILEQLQATPLPSPHCAPARGSQALSARGRHPVLRSSPRASGAEPLTAEGAREVRQGRLPGGGRPGAALPTPAPATLGPEPSQAVRRQAWLSTQVM